MSEKQHTSGPWELDDEGDFIFVKGDESKPIGQVRGWGWLSKKYPENEAIAIQRANGALMAQAPDLLAKVEEQGKEITELKESYKSLRLSVQRFHQTLIARNYNNIGVWHNERQQYNFELIDEVEKILIK